MYMCIYQVYDVLVEYRRWHVSCDPVESKSDVAVFFFFVTDEVKIWQIAIGYVVEYEVRIMREDCEEGLI